MGVEKKGELLIRVAFAWTLKSSAVIEPLKIPCPDSEDKPCEACPLFRISRSSCGCATRMSFLNSNQSCSPLQRLNHTSRHVTKAWWISIEPPEVFLMPLGLVDRGFPPHAIALLPCSIS